MIGGLEGSSVVFLSSRVGREAGRTERRLLATMRELARIGAHVHLIVQPGGALVEPARREGITTAVYRLDTANILRTRSRLRKYLKRYSVALAHSTGFEADVIVRLAAKGQPVRVVDSLTRSVWPPQGLRRPFSLLAETLELRTLPRADALLVDAADMRDALLVRGVPPERVTLDPPTIDLAALGTAAEVPAPGMPSGRPLVGFAGRQERGSGMKVLAAAARRLRELRVEAAVVVAGEGPEAAGVAGDPAVSVLGPVPGAPAVLRALDVVCVPSVVPGMPRTLLEALAMGRPTVAAAVPGVAEFFASGRELALVPPGDPAALAESVAELLANPVAAREMGERGRDRVTDEFSSVAGVRRHMRLYEGLLGR